MKSLCCSFCHKLDKENDLGELFQASKIKYHLYTNNIDARKYTTI